MTPFQRCRPSGAQLKKSAAGQKENSASPETPKFQGEDDFHCGRTVHCDRPNSLKKKGTLRPAGEPVSSDHPRSSSETVELSINRSQVRHAEPKTSRAGAHAKKPGFPSKSPMRYLPSMGNAAKTTGTMQSRLLRDPRNLPARLVDAPVSGPTAPSASIARDCPGFPER
jgi:hypothetical protein